MNADMESLLKYARRGWIITAEKNTAVICQKDPVRDIFFLLEGRVAVMNYIPWMDDNVIDYFQAPSVFGLVEYLNGDESYTAYVKAETRCRLLRFPIKEFDRMAKTDVSLCYQALLLLGKTTKESMNSSEVKKLLRPADSLGNYLFQLAQRSGIPYVYPLTRTVLAEELHMNLRTLYRYIDKMQKSGLILLRRGKIVIEKEQYERLRERYEDLLL